MPFRTALLLALLWWPTVAAAGTVVGESIWTKQNAIDRATQQLPAGAQVGGIRCETVEVGTGNDHYICTVQFSVPPSGAANGAPAGAPAAAPGSSR